MHSRASAAGVVELEAPDAPAPADARRPDPSRRLGGALRRANALVRGAGSRRARLKARLRMTAVTYGRGVYVSPRAILRTGSGARERIDIGDGCQILDGAILATYGGSIRLGCRVAVNPYTILYGHGGLTIGDDVGIAAHTVIVPGNHDFARRDVPIAAQGSTGKGIVIEDDVWIGAHVTILDGVRIGTGSVVGAGAVVTANVPPQSVVAGNPARVVRSRGEDAAMLRRDD